MLLNVKKLAQTAKAMQKPPAPAHDCPWCPVEKTESEISGDEPTSEEVRALAEEKTESEISGDEPTSEEVRALAEV
jgi:hypothetical protein